MICPLTLKSGWDTSSSRLLVLLFQSTPASEEAATFAEAGHPWRTVQYARRRAGVESRRIGFGADAICLWSLRTTPPEATPEPPPDAEAAR